MLYGDDQNIICLKKTRNSFKSGPGDYREHNCGAISSLKESQLSQGTYQTNFLFLKSVIKGS